MPNTGRDWPKRICVIKGCEKKRRGTKQKPVEKEGWIKTSNLLEQKKTKKNMFTIWTWRRLSGIDFYDLSLIKSSWRQQLKNRLKIIWYNRLWWVHLEWWGVYEEHIVSIVHGELPRFHSEYELQWKELVIYIKL